MTTATTGITGEKEFPATAGGNAGKQLRHLRAHRAFQRQDSTDEVRISWNTVITRAESRRHITRHLQAKINLKDPRQGSRGEMDTPEGQDSMKRLARMIQRRHRISPGDGYKLSWNLRRRMIQSSRSCLSDESTPTKEQGFPPEIRAGLDELQELRELLTRQGASPRRHRQATVIQVYACSQCHSLIHREVVEKEESPFKQCPLCQQSLREYNLVRVAVRNDGSRNPLGTVDCHRR